MVADFHAVADGHPSPSAPTFGTPELRALRARLIHEEADEVAEALEAPEPGDLSAVAKELADLLYVTYGTAVALGIDLNPVFEVVHRSNMAKFAGGVTRREDGKVLKPVGWKPPMDEIRKLLAAQA